MYVVLDVETTGLNFWEPDFKVISIAAAFKNNKGKIETKYEDTPAGIERTLNWVSQYNIVVHNASFEYGVFRYCYLDIQLPIKLDTLRLVQLFDGGGYANQLGLKDSAKRILGPEKGDWEKPIHDWIKQHYPQGAKKPGAFLQYAPKELLKPYNEADVIRTYELLDHILTRFEVAKYDWKPDMELYLYMVRKFTEAKADGISVNRVALANYIEELSSKILSIDDSFLHFFQDSIKDVQGILHAKAQAMFKKKIVTDAPKLNPGSTKHLEYLFCEVLKMAPKLQTPTGRPSFKSKHLSQWGNGGQILSGRSKAQFTKAQSNALMEKSSGPDKRWHPDLSPGTTITGRNKTYGGLNILALDRRDKGFMQTLLADNGRTLVSIDLVAGEPTVVANFSKDVYYNYATVSGVGKRPYWDKNRLMIDDIYLMFASCTPVGHDILKKEFSIDEWMTNPEEVKSKLKKIRQLHKVAALGLSYTMGPKKLQKTFIEAGHYYDEETCQAIYSSYWSLFADVKQFSDKLGRAVKSNKYLLNPFGFRCYPENPRLAFNYFCQSAVNGIMAILTMCIDEQAPYAKLITTIHDENIYSIAEDKIEEFRKAVLVGTKELNDSINWSVPIRTGFATGKNFYDAK